MTIFDVYRPVMRHFRGRRHEWFIKHLQPRPTDRLLDVGGLPEFWLRSGPLVRSIDCVNVYEVAWDPDKAPEHGIQTMVGDGCGLPFEDRSYDIAFSNSVIEHVGSWEQQQAFAREIRRVGRRLWVQTPAYECPIEPHYIAPFIHYLPRGLQKRILRHCTPWGLLQKPDRRQIEEAVDTTRLLKKREMEELFPDCTIIIEWLIEGLGIPKSYVAFRAD